MPGWSDIYGLTESDNEDEEGFNISAERVKGLIQKELDQGIHSTKIVLAGFSQGGALALHVSLRYPLQLAGCIALSSWLPLRESYPSALSPSSTTLPILQVVLPPLPLSLP
jgi:phospholipase/carboxylesterase